ncbi:Reverse transcriptase-like [Sesbania bispinosa]|nr:Reverse transcriptase-like [Sesbania bispinosa]
MHLVGWDHVVLPRKDGGLATRDARNTNISLLGKLTWKMIEDKDCLWAKEFLHDGFRMEFRNGDTSIWYQDWTGLSPLCISSPLSTSRILRVLSNNYGTMKDRTNGVGRVALIVIIVLKHVMNGYLISKGPSRIKGHGGMKKPYSIVLEIAIQPKKDIIEGPTAPFSLQVFGGIGVVWNNFIFNEDKLELGYVVRNILCLSEEIEDMGRVEDSAERNNLWWSSPSLGRVASNSSRLTNGCDRGLCKVLCESDSLEAIHLLHLEIIPKSAPYKDLLMDIRTLLQSNWDVSLANVIREANSVVDFLAKGAITMANDITLWDTPPLESLPLLTEDYMF